jgi:hypothetical protein
LLTSAGLALEVGVGGTAAPFRDANGVVDVLRVVVAGRHHLAEARHVDGRHLRAACPAGRLVFHHRILTRRHVGQAARGLHVHNQERSAQAQNRHGTDHAARTRHLSTKSSLGARSENRSGRRGEMSVAGNGAAGWMGE